MQMRGVAKSGKQTVPTSTTASPGFSPMTSVRVVTLWDADGVGDELNARGNNINHDNRAAIIHEGTVKR